MCSHDHICIVSIRNLFTLDFAFVHDVVLHRAMLYDKGEFGLYIDEAFQFPALKMEMRKNAV